MHSEHVFFTLVVWGGRGLSGLRSSCKAGGLYIVGEWQEMLELTLIFCDFFFFLLFSCLFFFFVVYTEEARGVRRSFHGVGCTVRFYCPRPHPPPSPQFGGAYYTLKGGHNTFVSSYVFRVRAFFLSMYSCLLCARATAGRSYLFFVFLFLLAVFVCWVLVTRPQTK